MTGNQESPQMPLRERIARAIFVHADHCRCGSGVIDPACITAKEDAVLAEVQTELDSRYTLEQIKEAVDTGSLKMERDALQAKNERLKKQLAGLEIVLDRMADVIARPGMEIRADLVALQDKCKAWAREMVNNPARPTKLEIADSLLRTLGLTDNP